MWPLRDGARLLPRTSTPQGGRGGLQGLQGSLLYSSTLPCLALLSGSPGDMMPCSQAWVAALCHVLLTSAATLLQSSRSMLPIGYSKIVRYSTSGLRSSRGTPLAQNGERQHVSSGAAVIIYTGWTEEGLSLHAHGALLANVLCCHAQSVTS